MRKIVMLLPVLLLLLPLGCKPPKSQKLLLKSLVESVTIGRQAIDEAFRLSKDKQVFRYIAASTASMFAKEAVTAIVMKQADKFGVPGRSKELCSMLLADYCYPLIDDVIAAEVAWYLQRFDPSFGGDTARPATAILLTPYFTKYNIERIAEKILVFLAAEPAADSSFVLPGVNTAAYTATRNWKDSGRVYEYRINNSALETRVGGGDWRPLPLPGGLVPHTIAADNNRCLVLTDNRELWWYCARQDQAQWSIDIMNAAVGVLALKPVLGDRVCDELLSLLTRITDSVSVRAAQDTLLSSWAGTASANAYWYARCSTLTQAVLNVEALLLKTGDGKTFTAKDYAQWSNSAHCEGAWSNLLSWTSGGSTFIRGTNVPNDSIVDIAIGNWNGTVSTMYILAQGKIWFIDEEIIQPEWKPIENWNAKWAFAPGPKDYRPIVNAPYPLDSSCRIDAANSVIAVSRTTDSASYIYWLRWDYHQKDDFVYWPLDWCEHSWYAAICPPRKGADFRISTIGAIDPRREKTVWSVPAPYFTCHTYLPDSGYHGIFGDVPKDRVDTYPVALFVTDTAGAVRSFSVGETKDMPGSKVEWGSVVSSEYKSF